jgi:hypothetical protein
MHGLKVVAAICLFATSARSELFLITGSYNEKWNYASESKLVRVAPDGQVSAADTLVEKGFVGVDVSYKANLAAFLVPGGLDDRGRSTGQEDYAIRFVSLRTGLVFKQCKLPTEYGRPYWADLPGREPVIETIQQHWPPREVDGRLGLIRVDRRVPCGDSFETAPLEDSRYFSPSGAAGVGSFVMSDRLDAFADTSGAVRKVFLLTKTTNVKVDLGIQLPAAAVSGENRNLSVDVRSPEIIVVTLWADGTGKPGPRSFAWNKSERRWSEIPQHLSDGVRRGFGPYIAITEAHRKGAVTAQIKEHPYEIHINKAVREEEGNPGSREWRTESGPSGPSLVESFAEAGDVFPGRLHVLDSRTGMVFTLTTNQADSEILLIAGGTMYYRVSNRLYSVPVLTRGLGRSRLLATDPLIGDAHWAFKTR